MVVLLTCKNEEDPIKNRGARLFTTLYINFSDAQGQITLELMVVSGRNLNSSKLSCMSLLPARMRMIDSKIKELECTQDFSRYKSMGIFPDAQGQLTPQSTARSNFELGRDFMVFFLTCKNEEDPIKNRGARVFTTLYINFSDAQRQITLELVAVSGQTFNSSKLSCMSSLPARMRIIDLKMKELECSQDFSHFKSMAFFPDAQGQLSPQSLVRSGRFSNSSEMLCMFSLPVSMKKI